ncbi:hypothetical protein ACIBF7_04775 [Nonomuraea sp. NPDC050478]|uniref:hypothetical protein n=1 Tax=Nonomuraea sp. NPDC050478 TaxID=3364365 RepID=UPI00378A780C
MLTPTDPHAYAAAIAPVIDAVHVNLHAATRRPGALGLLNDLRFTLPLRTLTRRDLAAVHRYGDDREESIREHVRRGELADDDGTLRLTERGLDLVHGLYETHAAAAGRIWRDHDVETLAALAGRVLGKAVAEPGDALAVMAPPYEPEGAPAGLLLFNRLAALRYARADAHAAAWQAAGLTAAEVVALEPGPLRERIEAGTNRRAAVPYEAFSEPERETLYTGLLALV